ncbi:MAG: hypothetical protein ACKO2Z_32235, partial [Sphaerospermopsis kisseleviana]
MQVTYTKVNDTLTVNNVKFELSGWTDFAIISINGKTTSYLLSKIAGYYQLHEVHAPFKNRYDNYSIRVSNISNLYKTKEEITAKIKELFNGDLRENIRPANFKKLLRDQKLKYEFWLHSH